MTPQASRAAHQGTEALLRDVRNLSPAQAALGEAELIQQYAGYSGQDDWATLARKLGNIGVGAPRLVARLAECDAAAGELRESLTWALAELQIAHGAIWEKHGWESYKPVVDARARLKGGS
jgi:hypothetical protein